MKLLFILLLSAHAQYEDIPTDKLIEMYHLNGDRVQTRDIGISLRSGCFGLFGTIGKSVHEE